MEFPPFDLLSEGLDKMVKLRFYLSAFKNSD